MSKQMTISYSEWEQIYRPLDEPYFEIDLDDADERPELRVALDVARKTGKLWTWVSGSAWDYATLVSGFHTVDRLGYCITDKSVAKNLEVFVMANRIEYVRIRSWGTQGKKQKSFWKALGLIEKAIQFDFPNTQILKITRDKQYPDNLAEVAVVDDADIGYRLCDEIQSSVEHSENGANSLNASTLVHLRQLIYKKMQL